MTLQDAIKTGLEFKRPFFTGWCQPGDTLGYTAKGDDIDCVFHVLARDVLADDWVVRYKRKFVTGNAKSVLLRDYLTTGHKLHRCRDCGQVITIGRQCAECRTREEMKLPNTLGPWKVNNQIHVEAFSGEMLLDVAKLRRELDTALEDVKRLNRNDDILTTRQRELSDKIAELAANQAASLPGWLLERVEQLEKSRDMSYYSGVIEDVRFLKDLYAKSNLRISVLEGELKSLQEQRRAGKW